MSSSKQLTRGNAAALTGKSMPRRNAPPATVIDSSSSPRGALAATDTVSEGLGACSGFLLGPYTAEGPKTGTEAVGQERSG